MKASHRATPVFDDPNLVGAAGLVPAMLLAESAGLHDLAAEHLQVPSASAAAKTTAIVAGMVAGADSIDDLDVLRHGAMPRLFTGVRAPSTLGTHLRAFTQGQIAQLDAVASRFLAGLAALVSGLLAGAGGPDADGIAYVDVDDTIRQVHGHAKQGAAYGYSKVKGLNAQLAVISTPLVAPVIAAAMLRKGNTASARGGGRLLARALSTARAAGVRCRVLVRADSAYYTHDFIAAAVRAGAWFSVTARMNAQVKAAIAGISEDAWTPIAHPNAVWEETEQRWVSDAEVAEVDLTCFTSRPKRDHVSCRLVVRRVKRVQPLAGDGTEQGELLRRLPPPRLRHQLRLRRGRSRRPPPRPRSHRTGHRRTQARRAGPPALRKEDRELGLAGPRGDGVQPRPRHRRPGRQPPRTSPLGHPAHPADQRARPTRHLSTPAHSPPAKRLALGHRVAPALRCRHRATGHHHHLITQPARRATKDQKWKSRADRRGDHARRQPQPRNGAPD